MIFFLCYKKACGFAMTKGRKKRHVFLTNSRVIDAFRHYLHDRQKQEGILFNYDAALFLSQKGDAFSPNTLQQLFHCMFREARLQGASSHFGRRSFATALIEKGIDIKAVSTVMGHSSIAMTAKYVQNNPVRLKQICTDLF
ncbi:tyrosine-type recombinase/integrase [Collimonas humicola]|uniref:tyrosine-type recombinase/integrase n=1 Tax=Collimonas humicola TaxID=2825886 RepID=UPI001B8D78E8|nr:tyrosine-type recombinase/integrase [Collimonas humicola]